MARPCKIRWSPTTPMAQVAGACASYRLESVATIGAARLLLRGDTLETRGPAVEGVILGVETWWKSLVGWWVVGGLYYPLYIGDCNSPNILGDDFWVVFWRWWETLMMLKDVSFVELWMIPGWSMVISNLNLFAMFEAYKQSPEHELLTLTWVAFEWGVATTDPMQQGKIRHVMELTLRLKTRPTWGRWPALMVSGSYGSIFHG